MKKIVQNKQNKPGFIPRQGICSGRIRLDKNGWYTGFLEEINRCSRKLTVLEKKAVLVYNNHIFIKYIILHSAFAGMLRLEGPVWAGNNRLKRFSRQSGIIWNMFSGWRWRTLTTSSATRRWRLPCATGWKGPEEFLRKMPGKRGPNRFITSAWNFCWVGR